MVCGTIRGMTTDANDGADSVMRPGSMRADLGAPYGLGVLRGARLVQLLALLHGDMGAALRGDAAGLPAAAERWRETIGGLLGAFGEARPVPSDGDGFTTARLAAADAATAAGDTAALMAVIRHLEAEGAGMDVRGPLIERHVLELARRCAAGDRAALSALVLLAQHAGRGGTSGAE